MTFETTFNKDEHSPLSSLATLSTGPALQVNSGVHVGAISHVSDLTYVDDIVLLSNNYRVLQCLSEAVGESSGYVH